MLRQEENFSTKTLLKKTSTPKPSLVKELVKMFMMKHVKCMSQITMCRLLGSIGKSLKPSFLGRED